jgi:hypothetical protein
MKVLFVFFAMCNFYLKKKNGNSGGETKLEKKITYYKNLTENIFIVLVSILLIYLFNPYYDNKYLLDDKHVKFLVFMYGTLMLITFDWSEFARFSS